MSQSLDSFSTSVPPAVQEVEIYYEFKRFQKNGAYRIWTLKDAGYNLRSCERTTACVRDYTDPSFADPACEVGFVAVTLDEDATKRASGYGRKMTRDANSQLYNDTPAGDDNRLLNGDDGIIEVVRMSDGVAVRCDRVTEVENATGRYVFFKKF